jgi:hypothetical protein
MGARKVHSKAMRLILESWMLTMKPWRLSLELWRLTMGGGGSPCCCRITLELWI